MWTAALPLVHGVVHERRDNTEVVMFRGDATRHDARAVEEDMRKTKTRRADPGRTSGRRARAQRQSRERG